MYNVIIFMYNGTKLYTQLAISSAKLRCGCTSVTVGATAPQRQQIKAYLYKFCQFFELQKNAYCSFIFLLQKSTYLDTISFSKKLYCVLNNVIGSQLYYIYTLSTVFSFSFLFF